MVTRAPKPRTEPYLFGTFEQALARFRLSPPQDTSNHDIVDYIARQSIVEHAGQWTWHFDPTANVAQARDLK